MPSTEHSYFVKYEITSWLQSISPLPLERRNVLLLRDYYGFSYKEIAEMTGLSLAKVKIELHRGRKETKSIKEWYRWVVQSLKTVGEIRKRNAHTGWTRTVRKSYRNLCRMWSSFRWIACEEWTRKEKLPPKDLKVPFWRIKWKHRLQTFGFILSICIVIYIIGGVLSAFYFQANNDKRLEEIREVPSLALEATIPNSRVMGAEQV